MTVAAAATSAWSPWLAGLAAAVVGESLMIFALTASIARLGREVRRLAAASGAGRATGPSANSPLASQETVLPIFSPNSAGGPFGPQAPRDRRERRFRVLAK